MCEPEVWEQSLLGAYIIFQFIPFIFFFGLICKEENKTFLRVKIACLESNQYSLKKKEDCFMKLSVLSSIQEFYATYY